MSAYDRHPIFPPNCSWCGHEPHAGVCPGTIVVGPAKNRQEKPCPCALRKK